MGRLRLVGRTPRRPSGGELARYAAPAAFLLAATIAVLLVRAQLGDDGGSSLPPAPRVDTTLRTGSTTTTRPTTSVSTVAAARYYTIQRGDTLSVVAFREHTTVADIIHLNPGIDPHSLQVGQKIRVG